METKPEHRQIGKEMASTKGLFSAWEKPHEFPVPALSLSDFPNEVKSSMELTVV